MRRLITRLAPAFTFALLISSADAFAAPGDYDGDGFADLAIIDADEPESKTTVFVRQSSNGAIRSYVFHPFGNTVISGNFFGDGKTYPGIVSNRGAAPLLWTIKGTAGQDIVFNYGASGDQVPNQGDLDCDGVTDLAVVRNGTATNWPGFKLWYIALTSQPGAVVEAVFGLQGDEPYIGDVNGDGCGELMVLRSGFQWFSKSVFSEEYSQVQWGLPGDIPLLPADVNGDGVPEYIVTRPVGSVQLALIRFSDGSSTTAALGSSGSIPLVGQFFGPNTFGWFERSQGKFGLRRADNSVASVTHGNPRRGIVRPDGTEVTEEESGRFVGTPAAPVSGGSGSQVGDITCDQVLALRDGAGNFKNNPENSKNTLKIMYPSFMTGKISSVTCHFAGQLVDTLRLGGFEWGNRNRFYGTKSLSSYPDNLLVVANMNDGRKICVTLPDPQRVYD